MGALLVVVEGRACSRGVTAAVLARAARFDVRVQAWTVNDRVEMERLLDLGVHGIMTDDPELLRDVLAGR